ncbi:hypothetical protein HPB50_001586 [Hyalomma asiaticum]|uniref:Uncharacterized protein n=1 Tax=Hyalomma asiaticum TaxID=266040 RepID=A0ACB7SJK7_HYAAI|nr:hypothetical protein HPB50_001586 [Hyalomma asiaticum]
MRAATKSPIHRRRRDLACACRAAEAKRPCGSTKRKRLPLSDKLKILQCLDSGQRQVDVVKDYGIAPNVRVEYLPPNCTAVLQPLDLGIIQNLKVEYRRRLVQRILTNIRIGNNEPINVRQGAEMDANEQEEHDEVIDSGMWTDVCQQLDVDSGASFEDYVQCDSDLVTCAELSDLEIVSSVRPEPEKERDEEVVTAEAGSNPVTLV